MLLKLIVVLCLVYSNFAGKYRLHIENKSNILMSSPVVATFKGSKTLYSSGDKTKVNGLGGYSITGDTSLENGLISELTTMGGMHVSTANTPAHLWKNAFVFVEGDPNFDTWALFIKIGVFATGDDRFLAPVGPNGDTIVSQAISEGVKSRHLYVWDSGIEDNLAAGLHLVAFRPSFSLTLKEICTEKRNYMFYVTVTVWANSSTAISPPVWGVANAAVKPFLEGRPASKPLEYLAELGNPWYFDNMLVQHEEICDHAVIGNGPLVPGKKVTFRVNAAAGDCLLMAFMYESSNDKFFSPELPIPLFNSTGSPVYADITNKFVLWDAGTEIDEMPGSGPNQPANKQGIDDGWPENGVVTRAFNNFAQGFIYSTPQQVFQVSLSNTPPNPQ